MNILVVGPHPDDQELGMGGTIARLASLGHRVVLLDMTNGEPTPLGDPATRAKEAASAAKILSSPRTPVTRVMLGLPNRVVQHSLGARHAVAKVIRQHQIQVMFVPFFEDAHPDHKATTSIAEDARFDAKLRRMTEPGQWRAGELLEIPGVDRDAASAFIDPPDDRAHPPIYPKWLFYYYATHLRWPANPTFCIDITGFLDSKIESIRAYETQFVRANAHVVEWVHAAGVYFGSRVGAGDPSQGVTGAAEPFYSKEPLGLTDLTSLA